MPSTAPMDELLDERLAHRGEAGEDAAVARCRLRTATAYDLAQVQLRRFYEIPATCTGTRPTPRQAPQSTD